MQDTESDFFYKCKYLLSYWPYMNYCHQS